MVIGVTLPYPLKLVEFVAIVRPKARSLSPVDSPKIAAVSLHLDFEDEVVLGFLTEGMISTSVDQGIDEIDGETHASTVAYPTEVLYIQGW
jgi:hypothetical protein